MPRSYFIAMFALVFGLLIGWWVSKDAVGTGQVKKKEQKTVTQPTVIEEPKQQDSKRRKLTQRPNSIDELLSLPNERLIHFKNEEDYQNFLKQLGSSNVKLLGSIDPLFAVRVGYQDFSDFDALGLDNDDLLGNYYVSIPLPTEVEEQEGVVGFGTGALNYLGINGDNSNWGTGVKIAIIDTGIEPHLAFNKEIQRINLIEISEGAEAHGHGTAVASLAAGNHPNLKGVAPAADLLSVRVADETGLSNSFLLAEGIVAAVDNGAQILNISLGSYGDSIIVKNAVDYALATGAVILASSGNEGYSEAAYPAAYPGVISVGAIDARGTHLNFSNASDTLGLTGPGLEVTAAWPGDNITPFTGTSGAVAFPTGAIAAVMSESGGTLSAQQAAEILSAHSNEAGQPGSDPFFGSGILDVGRAIQRDTPGIEDIAVASQTYLLPVDGDSTSGLQVSVENRGTETIWHPELSVSIAGGDYQYQINSLRPNERRVITVPAGLQQLRSEGSLLVRSRITVSETTNDIIPANDRRTEVVSVPVSSGNGP